MAGGFWSLKELQAARASLGKNQRPAPPLADPWGPGGDTRLSEAQLVMGRTSSGFETNPCSSASPAAAVRTWAMR